MSDIYDADFVAWISSQADLLRRVAAGECVNDQVDWANIIEEIESLGREQEREFAYHVRILLEHLLLLEASPVNDPTREWRPDVARKRSDIRRLLKDSPSLRLTIDTIVAEELPAARKLAVLALKEYDEEPTVPLDQFTYTGEQVLGRWLPGSSSGVAALAEAARECFQAAERLKAGSRRRKSG